MTSKRLSVPEPGVRELAHRLAYKIARERLAELKDIELQCRHSGARCLPDEKSVVLDHLNRSYQINLSGEVAMVGSDEAVPIRDKILILHYFLRATGAPLTGQLITYKELQEGINYYPTFFKRAIEPIVNNFKDRLEKLPETAAALGGKRAEYGDTAVTIPGFPNVPLTIVLWRGDKEFPPEGNILFDSTIGDYLPTEDVTIICEKIAWSLVRLLKTGGDAPGHR
jgi:hypothetical protein